MWSLTSELSSPDKAASGHLHRTLSYLIVDMYGSHLHALSLLSARVLLVWVADVLSRVVAKLTVNSES